jgi:hypothetical protein
MRTETRIAPHSIDDRVYWNRVASDACFAPVRAALLPRAEKASATPPLPAASDFLAARRLNDRARIDRYWQTDRGVFSALAFRRCLLGIDPADPDDRLLDWLWSMLTCPTWTVSAHLPGNDLPALGQPILDLASCEMAALLAEVRQVLKPWMDGHSKTLADSIVRQIDDQILTPYAAGLEVWWDNPDSPHINNWVGVCAGNILAACESLAAQGHPRPQARARALKGLRLFFERGFTASGECDEGVMYWNYGVGMACLGLSRLSREELNASLDTARFNCVADYPRRAYLFGNSFFTANDGGLKATAGASFAPWLAVAAESEWLAAWTRRGLAMDLRHFGQIVNALAAMERMETSPAAPGPGALESATGTQWLPDQQAAIIRLPGVSGRLLVTLSGGHNAERHNHNDLGHFMAAVDDQWIIPDLGAPQYTADFFGPRRYSYLAASSRGHCCPLIAGQEQRDGLDAAGKVLRWESEPSGACLELDLTAAYPAEARLKQWIRKLSREAHQAVLTDTFTTEGGAPVTQVLWSFVKPVVDSPDRVHLGRLLVALAPVPRAVRVIEVNPADHGLRDFKEPLYRLEADYSAPSAGTLVTHLTLSVE